MITIIAGIRYRAGTSDVFDNYGNVKRAVLMSGFTITKVISGHALGVDRLGEQWAKEVGVPLHLEPVTSEMYKKYGSGKAPYLRNEWMADNADALIAVWDGYSRGTFNMINIAKKKGLKVFVYRIDSGAGTYWAPDQESLFTKDIQRIGEELLCQPKEPESSS